MITKEKIINFCSRLSRYSLYSIVFFVPIYFAWFQENYTVFDLNKSVALHFFLSICIVAFLLELTLTKFFKWGGNRIIGLSAVALIGIFSLSTIFSLHPNISLLGSYERQQGLYNLWSYVAVWFFVIVTIKNHSHLRQLIIFSLLGATIATLYGLIQAFGLDFLSWGETYGRIFSSLGQPNFFGHYLVVILPFSVYAIFFLSKNIYIRLFFILLTSFEVVCLIITLSRGAWIALLFTLFLLLIWSLFRENKKIYAWVLLFLSASLFITFAFTNVRQSLVLKFSNANFKVMSRLVSVFDFEGGSNKVRLYYWQAAWDSIRQAPLERKLLGYGPDALPDIFAKVYQPEWSYYENINSFPDRSHNFIFDILLQFGFAGLLVFGFFSGYSVWRLGNFAWKEKEGDYYWLAVAFLFSLVAYGINNLFSFSLVEMNVLLYSLLGGSWLISNRFSSKEISIRFFQPLSLLILTVSFSFFLLILFYSYNVKPLIADYYYFEVKKGEAQGDCRRVLDNMEKTLEWYLVSHYYARAYLHHGANCYLAVRDEASQEQLSANLLEQAARIPESDWQYLTILDLAHTYSKLGYYKDKKYYLEAEKYYQELEIMGPMITITYQDYGRMKLDQSKYDEAINLFKKGIEVARLNETIPSVGHAAAIYRQVAYFYNLLGTAYSKNKEDEQAIFAYKRAIDLNPLEGSYYKDIADLYYLQKNISEAVYYNELGYSFEPESEPWEYFLALLYNEQGDKKRALEYANKSLNQDPNNEKIISFIKELKEGK
jgi:O-antigen ligase/Tfp pilus assembly protein PilF